MEAFHGNIEKKNMEEHILKLKRMVYGNIIKMVNYLEKREYKEEKRNREITMANILYK